MRALFAALMLVLIAPVAIAQPSDPLPSEAGGPYARFALISTQLPPEARSLMAIQSEIYADRKQTLILRNKLLQAAQRGDRLYAVGVGFIDREGAQGLMLARRAAMMDARRWLFYLQAWHRDPKVEILAPSKDVPGIETEKEEIFSSEKAILVLMSAPPLD